MNTENPTDNVEAAKTACGGKLKNTKGFPGDVYHGEIIYFCSLACWQLFKQYPDEFMAGQIEHPPEDG